MVDLTKLTVCSIQNSLCIQLSVSNLSIICYSEVTAVHITSNVLYKDTRSIYLPRGIPIVAHTYTYNFVLR